MERESWKNLGLAGSAVIVLGCGALWVSSMGTSEEAVQLVNAPRPIKVVENPRTDHRTQPKPGVTVAVDAPKRPFQPTTPMIEPGRKPPRKPKDAVPVRRIQPPAA